MVHQLYNSDRHKHPGSIQGSAYMYQMNSIKTADFLAQFGVAHVEAESDSFTSAPH